MFLLKNKYFLIIQNTKDLNLKNIKKYNKFIIIYRNKYNDENITQIKEFRKKCKLKTIKFSKLFPKLKAASNPPGGLDLFILYISP